MGISETKGSRPKENAPHEAGHYLSLVARGGIEPGPRISNPASRLESSLATGKDSPSLTTLRKYAAALGKRVALHLV